MIIKLILDAVILICTIAILITTIINYRNMEKLHEEKRKLNAELQEERNKNHES